MALSFGPLYQDFYGDLKKRREEEAVARSQGVTLPAVQMSNQVKSRASQLPKQNGWDLIRDTFDANTAQDKYRRSIAGQPEDYVAQQKSLGNPNAVTNPLASIGTNFLQSTTKSLGMAGRAGELTPEQAKKNQELYDQGSQTTMELRPTVATKDAKGNTVFASKNNVVNRNIDQQFTNPADAAEATKTYLEAGVKAKLMAKNPFGGKTLVGKMAAEGGQNVVFNAADQLTADDKRSIQQKAIDSITQAPEQFLYGIPYGLLPGQGGKAKVKPTIEPPKVSAPKVDIPTVKVQPQPTVRPVVTGPSAKPVKPQVEAPKVETPAPVTLKGQEVKSPGFSRAGEGMDMSRYQRTGQTPEEARIADISKRTGVSEETLVREAAKRGGIDSVEGTANSLIDDTAARNKDAVFVSKLKDTAPVAKETPKTKGVAPQPTKTDLLDVATAKKNIQEVAKNGRWEGWYGNGDTGYLPMIEKDILANKSVRDAGASLFYDNYKKANNTDIEFDEFMNKDITLYRGGKARTDNIVSYSFDKNMAARHGEVSSITVKPKDTYGMFTTTAEQEVLVPIKSATAPKPKVTAKDMLPVREDVPYDIDPATGAYRTAADMIDNAPEAKKVSAVQAQEITGSIVNRVDEGMDAVDNILKGKGSSLEEMFRAIQTAMRNGDAFPEQYRAEYNMVKATLDKLRDASGKEMGDIGDGYLPQFRPDGGPQVQVGKSLVELIDMEDFGFSKKRENLIPLEELDYTKEGIKKYATQSMSYKYRDALDIEAIQKRAMETDGVKLTDKEALAVRDKEVEIAKDVQEAASKPGAILKADILDKTDELAAVKKKKRIEISDTVSFAKRELLDTDTLTRDIQLRTPEGKTKNMFEVFGFRRYRDAEGNAKQILYKALEDGDYESIQQHIAATNLPENTQKNLLKQLGDDLRAVQSRVDELDLPESKIADATKELYEGALTKFERRIAREELTRAMETYKISNKGLRKVVNFHAQRMLTHDGYTRNMAEKATNFVTGLYYRGALGYNFSSALLNLFELQRVTSEVGMINGAKAIGKAITDWDITKRYGLHESTFENLLELKKEGVNVKRSKLSKVENYSGLMKMFEWTERIKDATLLHALEAKYADAGLSKQARVTRILADFNKLAIKGGQFGSVGLYKSKTGRTLFQFMQYPIKDLTITAGKIGKAFGGDTEASKYLARLVVQRAILYMVMNAAIGTSAEVAFGIFNPVRQARIDEEAGLDEKVVSYFPGGPAISMLKDTYIAMQQAQREAERNDEQFDPADVLNKQVTKDLTLLVPGGNQLINKSLGFYNDMQRGYNQSSYKNDKGEEVNRARFATPDNLVDQVKGYVFGPYATKDANEYFGKKVGSDLPVVGDKLAGEKYSPVSKRQQERIEAGGNARELIEEERVNQRAKKEFKKTNPNLWAAYQEITKTTYNESTKKRESDVITPEKWSKVYGDSSLKLYDYMKQMAEARNKQYGDPVDPLYKLTDKAKIKTVLELRSTFTGDDKEPKEILKARSPWFAQFQKDEANYYSSLGKFEEDSDFGSSDRKKQYIELGKQNPGIPDVSKQKYPIISQYFDMKEKNPDAAKDFYKSNADALSAAFEKQKKDRWEWTNQMRSLEGAPSIPWEAFQNVTFGYEDDEEKVAKALYFKGKSGSGYGKGGSNKVSMKNIYSYGSGLTPRKAKAQTVKKIAAPKVKVASSKTTKPKVTMKKSKV